MDDPEPMRPRAGRNQEIGGGYGEAPAARRPCELAGEGPDTLRRGHGLELLLQLAEQAVLPGAAGAVPQLQPHEIAEDRPIVGRQGAHPAPDCRIAARPQGFDPSRRVDEIASAVAQGSSRIRRRSSWVMKPSSVPNASASFWSRRLRLKSERAITTASRLVFAPVCRIASRSS